MNHKELWKRCAEFHGHECGGLMIGFRAALYAMELLDLNVSKDEETVCISENDACGVDAVQVLLGCSAGKGNLLFHLRGKQAFSFYNRTTGKSARLVLKERPSWLKQGMSMEYYRTCKPEEMFEVKQTRQEVPEPARHFISYRCDGCGESTASNWIRLEGDRKLCLDCFHAYNRFDV